MAGPAPLQLEAREVLSRALRGAPPGPPFTPLQQTMCVLAAKVDAPCIAHREFYGLLAEMQEPREGVVIAFNSNFGGRCQPGYESFVKQGGKQQAAAPAGRKLRQPEGRGGSLNSSVEPIVRPPPDSPIGKALAAHGTEVLKLKYFPNTGSMQVSGARLPGFADGIWAIREWIAYLNRIGVYDRPATLIPGSIHPESVNFKYRLVRMSPRLAINFAAFAGHILAEFHEAVAREGPETPGRWPAPLWETTFKDPKSSSQGAFKFVGRVKDKGPRVNIFIQSGKINLLGCPSYEFGQRVFDEMSDLFKRHWEKFVVLVPLNDSTLVGSPVEVLTACLRLLKTQPGAGGRPDSPPPFTNSELNLCLEAVCGADGAAAPPAAPTGGVVLDDYFSQFAV